MHKFKPPGVASVLYQGGKRNILAQIQLSIPRAHI